jgi:hypothetical protein
MGYQIKYFILLTILVTSHWGEACIGLARTVALDNSPYFFDQFHIAGWSFRMPMALGQQDVTFTCERVGDQIQWNYQATNDGATDVDDSVARTALPNGSQLYDNAEVPRVTIIGPSANGPNGATMDFRSSNSGNYFTLTCNRLDRQVGEDGRQSPPMAQMTVDFKNAQGEVIAQVGATQRTDVRSLGGGSDPDARVDMAQLTPGQVNFPGCGGGPIESGQGQGVRN